VFVFRPVDLGIQYWSLFLMIWYCCVPIRDWSFVARFLASRKPYFYSPIHAELSKLVISKQFLILPIHPAWCFDKLQVVIANHPIPTCVIICSKSANLVLLQFQRILHPQPVLLRIENSQIVIANISFVSIMTCDWKIVCFIAKTYAFLNLVTESFRSDYC
jgi:hypothetical protein